MIRRVIVRPEARRELARAAEWYRNKSPVLPGRFRLAIRELIESVSENPEAYPLVREHIRRALARTFPYAVFFAIDGNQIVVIAIVHEARDPKGWPAEV